MSAYNLIYVYTRIGTGYYTERYWPDYDGEIHLQQMADLFRPVVIPAKAGI